MLFTPKSQASLDGHINLTVRFWHGFLLCLKWSWVGPPLIHKCSDSAWKSQGCSDEQCGRAHSKHRHLSFQSRTWAVSEKWGMESLAKEKTKLRIGFDWVRIIHPLHYVRMILCANCLVLKKLSHQVGPHRLSTWTLILEFPDFSF